MSGRPTCGQRREDHPVTDQAAAHHPERRRHARLAAAHPCKVRHEASRGYLAGSTIDVGAGGAFVALDARRLLAEGDVVSVGICPDAARVLVEPDDLRLARVVRREVGDSRIQRVALAYIPAREQALAA
jgi:hypothetical protein